VKRGEENKRYMGNTIPFLSIRADSLSNQLSRGEIVGLIKGTRSIL